MSEAAQKYILNLFALAVILLSQSVRLQAIEPITEVKHGFFQIEGGIPRYMSTFDSDVFGLYKFSAAGGILKLQWRFGAILETSLYSVSIKNLQELQADLPLNTEQDIRISVNKIGLFVDLPPPTIFFGSRIGALNHENCIHIVVELGMMSREVRNPGSGEPLGAEGEPAWLFYTDIGMRFTQRLNRSISVISQLELGLVNPHFDTYLANSVDLVASFSLGLEINSLLPRPHRFE